MEKDFNPSLLRLARDLRGFTQAYLADRAGCKQAFLSHVEHGFKTPTPDRAIAIANALEFPVDFFYQEGEYKGLGVSFVFNRKRQRAQAAHVTRLQAEAALRRLVVRRILRDVEIQPTTRTFAFMDVDDFDGPADVAGLLRASWQLPSGPIQNLIGVIENAGGIVFKFSFGTSDIDAMGQWPDDTPPLFFLNADAPTDRLRFSLAHELGHVVMHREATDEMEAEADRFASEFLMPACDVGPDLIDLSISKAARIKPYWRCSMASLIRRAHDLAYLDDASYRRMWKDMSRFGIRKVEPAAIHPEEPRFFQHLLEIVADAAAVSSGGLAGFLRLSNDDLKRHVLGPQSGLRIAV